MALARCNQQDNPIPTFEGTEREEGAFQSFRKPENVMPFAPQELTLDTVKGFVDRYLRSQKKLPVPSTWPPKRATAQETVAHMLGFPNWHALHATLANPSRTRTSTPSGPVVLGNEHYAVMPGAGNGVTGPTTFTWSDPSEVVSLIGAARDRHMVIHHVRTQQKRPVLWLRSNLAYDADTHTPGYGFLPTNGYQLYGILDEIFTLWPSPRIVDVLMSLVEADEDEDAKMWRNRARDLISAVLSALVYLRDHHKRPFDVQVLREALSLPGLIMLLENPLLSPDMSARLMDYGRSLPSPQEDFPHKFSTTALDQHGYLQMQFTRVLASAVELTSPAPLGSVQILALNEVDGLPPGASTTEHAVLLATYIQVWIEKNPGGVLVFDGLVPESPSLGLLDWARDEWAGVNGTHLLLASRHPYKAPQSDHVLSVHYQP